jgi:hypothetical protein
MIPIGPVPEVYDLIRSVGRSEEDLDRQIKDAFDSLGKSSALVEKLSGVLQEREIRLKTLQAEYERTAQLATLTKEQASAVANSLELALGKSAGRERLISFAINIAAGIVIFILGVFASEWIKGLASHFAHRVS